MDTGRIFQWPRIIGHVFPHLEEARQGLVLLPVFQLHDTEVDERIEIGGVFLQGLNQELLGFLKMALFNGFNGRRYRVTPAACQKQDNQNRAREWIEDVLFHV